MRTNRKKVLIIVTPLIVASIAMIVGSNSTGAAELKDSNSDLTQKRDGCRSLGPDSAPAHSLMPVMSINQLVSTSHSGVKASVRNIGQPRWNSLDGKRWCTNEGDPSTPHAFETMYREADIQVEEVYFESPQMPVKSGDVLTIRIPGPGPEASEATVAGHQLKNNELCCEFDVVGSKVVLFLNRDLVDTKEGPIMAITVNGNMLGRWRIEGAVAKSRLVERSVSSKSLTDRIKSERAVGKRNETQEAAIDTSLNPLGGSAELIQERAKIAK